MVGLKVPQPERAFIAGIPVEVQRTRRRRTRIGLAFDPAGIVLVEAPLDATRREVRAVILEHQRWLRHRLEKVTDSAALTACVRYAAGEVMHYLGRAYELTVEPGAAARVRLRWVSNASAFDAEVVVALRALAPPLGVAGVAEAFAALVAGEANHAFRQYGKFLLAYDELRAAEAARGRPFAAMAFLRPDTIYGGFDAAKIDA